MGTAMGDDLLAGDDRVELRTEYPREFVDVLDAVVIHRNRKHPNSTSRTTVLTELLRDFVDDVSGLTDTVYLVKRGKGVDR
jgi:predicted hydrolase (HD superfamily)